MRHRFRRYRWIVFHGQMDMGFVVAALMVPCLYHYRGTFGKHMVKSALDIAVHVLHRYLYHARVLCSNGTARQMRVIFISCAHTILRLLPRIPVTAPLCLALFALEDVGVLFRSARLAICSHNGCYRTYIRSARRRCWLVAA